VRNEYTKDIKNIDTVIVSGSRPTNF